MATRVLTSGVVEVATGDAVRLPMDFGNLRQLIAGAAVVGGVLTLQTNVASFDVTCTGTGAPAVTRKQLDYPYQISALFTCPTPGEYNAVYTVTLDDPDASVFTRTGVLRVL